MINTTNLTYQYNDQNSFEFPVMSCKASETSLILGKSGVGKTTLLHLLCGLMKPNSGNIYVDGNDLTDLSGSTLDKFRGDHLGIVFQRNHFIRALTVIDNLMITQNFTGTKDRAFAMHLLDELSISHKSGEFPYNLSEGEKQRVSIARALVNKPKVILADEPTSALDDDNCTKVLGLLRQQATEIGAALLIVTHDTRLKDMIDHQTILS